MDEGPSSALNVDRSSAAAGRESVVDHPNEPRWSGSTFSAQSTPTTSAATTSSTMPSATRRGHRRRLAVEIG